MSRAWAAAVRAGSGWSVVEHEPGVLEQQVGGELRVAEVAGPQVVALHGRDRAQARAVEDGEDVLHVQTA